MVDGRVAYLDASALVKLVVEEPESGSMLAFAVAHPRQATSVVARVEVPRASLRTGMDVADRERAILASITVIGLDEAIATRAADLRPATLRSLDAIHLATAMSLGPALEAFVTYDNRLAAAASALGLPVVSPS